MKIGPFFKGRTMNRQQGYPIFDRQGNKIAECEVIRADRKSVSIRVKENGTVEVRIPRLLSLARLDELLTQKVEWIRKTRALLPEEEPVSLQEQSRIQALEKRFRRAAAEYIPSRVLYYQKLTGGQYARIVIRDQKTRWGSCSSNGTLSFNYRLMLAPPKVLDYVVVHELCHLKHMDHSPAFWQAVEQVLPEYKTQKQWLKEHGHELTIQKHLQRYGQEGNKKL